MQANRFERRKSLTSAQLEIWLDLAVHGDDGSWNIADCIHIVGRIDYDCFRQAIGAATVRTAALRLHFQLDKGAPTQAILPAGDSVVSFVNVSVSDDPEGAARHIMELERRKLFKPEGPHSRHVLIQVAEQQYYWVAIYFHLSVDCSAMRHIAKHVAEAYSDIRSGTPRTAVADDRLYEQWLEDDRHFRHSPDFTRAREYWGRVYALPAPVVSLATRATAPRLERSTSRRTIALPSTGPASLDALSADCGVSAAHCLTALASILLFKLTGSRDIPIGFAVHGRPAPLVRLSAMCANVVPIRIQLEPSSPIKDAIVAIAADIKTALEHARYRSLQEDLGTDLVKSPPYSLIINVMSLDYALTFGDARAASSRWLNSGPVDDLALVLRTRHLPQSVGSELSWYANGARHDERDLERYFGYLELLILNARLHPECTIADTPLIGESERGQLAACWSGATDDGGNGRLLHQEFERRAEALPAAIAVIGGCEQLSYQELNWAAERAARLLLAHGVGPESVVGVLMERSAESVTALLAVLKAGATYLPMDPELPEARLALMLAETGAPIVLVSARTRVRVPAAFLGRVIGIPVEGQEPAPVNSAAQSTVRPGNIAYLIYTSGSTGRPKAVAMTHSGLMNHIAWQQAQFLLGNGDRIVHKTSIGFDASLTELLWPLLVGATVVVAPSDTSRDPVALIALMREARVSVLQGVPSLLRMLLGEPAFRACSDLRLVLSGGEVLDSGLTRSFGECLPLVTLYNLYGPTEAAVDVSSYKCATADAGTIVPIGRPIYNTRLMVLDDKLGATPKGVVGELWVAGRGLARGYFAHPSLTADRFRADPYGVPGDRMYRTGDMARYRLDGNLEFMGRGDQQVKIRGYRVELGEIEMAICTHPEVSEAVVVTKGSDPATLELAAYFCGKASDRRPSTMEIRDFLLDILPTYMVPRLVVGVTRLPRLANGKVHRAALPAVQEDPRPTCRPYVAPESEFEKALAVVWRNALDVDRIGTNDNFFELGGNSLRAVALVAAIRDSLGIEYSVGFLFKHPTIAAWVSARPQ